MSDPLPYPFLNLEGCRNFRDVCGPGDGYLTAQGRVRRGRVYRSGHFAMLKGGSAQALKAMGLSKVVDLREAKECSDCPTPEFLGGDRVVHLPAADIDPHNFTKQLEKPDPNEIAKQQLAVYAERPYSRAVLWRQFFDLMLDENNYPMVFHCMLGKDRTGILAALLQGILGVSREDIIADYMLTDEVHDPSPNSDMTPQEIADMYDVTLEQLMAYKQVAVVRTELIEASIDSVMAGSGSFERYFKNELGLSSEDIETLRRTMLSE